MGVIGILQVRQIAPAESMQPVRCSDPLAGQINLGVTVTSLNLALRADILPIDRRAEIMITGSGGCRNPAFAALVTAIKLALGLDTAMAADDLGVITPGPHLVDPTDYLGPKFRGQITQLFAPGNVSFRHSR
jgi:hypothetical protein